jgi:hypothetical protein
MSKRLRNAAIIVLVIVFTLTACKSSDKQISKDNTAQTTENNNISTITPLTPAKNYTYDENKFKERYEEALSAIKKGEIPEAKAVNNLDEKGFAIIPLDKEVYGIDNFAVLPVLTRELTDTELLQLAYEMGEIPFDDLISSNYSYMGNAEESFLYRPFSWDERIRYFELDSLYRYEELRSSKVHTNDASFGGPIYIDLITYFRDAVKYWIYPKLPMNDDQLLQILSVRYNFEKEHYQPLEGEIPFYDVEKTAMKLIDTYQITEDTLEMCMPYYWQSKQYNDSDVSINFWIARLHFSDGFDYNVKFKAYDGSLMGWYRCPKGYYGKTEPEDFKYRVTDSNNSNYSDDDFLRAVENYVTRMLLKDDVTIKESMVSGNSFDRLYYGEGLIIEGSGKVITLTLSTDEVYKITVMGDDLSVQSVEKR